MEESERHRHRNIASPDLLVSRRAAMQGVKSCLTNSGPTSKTKVVAVRVASRAAVVSRSPVNSRVKAASSRDSRADSRSRVKAASRINAEN
jgi:hypothetical protein